MVMIKCPEGVERYFVSTKTYNLCMRIRQKIHEEDSEVWGCLFGPRGAGKSLKAQHIAYVIDPTLELTRICFSKAEFIDAVKKSKKKVIILDEAISIFFSRASMTKEGRLVAEISDQIRQKNLCVILCVPNILSLDWMVLESLHFAGYVYESAKIESKRKVRTKGNMFMYLNMPGRDTVAKLISYKKKKRAAPHKFYRMPRPNIIEPGNPIGPTFKKPWYPVPESEYRKKKESILDKHGSNVEKPERIIRRVYNSSPRIEYDIMDALIKERKFKQKEIAQIMGCGIRTVQARKQKIMPRRYKARNSAVLLVNDSFKSVNDPINITL